MSVFPKISYGAAQSPQIKPKELIWKEEKD